MAGTSGRAPAPAGRTGGPRDELLAAIGPRLRALRRQRGTTLAKLAEVTGTSASTLSRLESGQRRPTLELLLPVTDALDAALSDLLEPPATGDPRVSARPAVRGGITFLPLTRRPEGQQAYKLLVPARTPTGGPREQAHPGYEWFYVLTGRIRLLLGEHDLTLRAGEVAEFDTRTPHWFGNPGARPAEVLALFSSTGERLHVRARRRSTTSPGSRTAPGSRPAVPDGQPGRTRVLRPARPTQRRAGRRER